MRMRTTGDQRHQHTWKREAGERVSEEGVRKSRVGGRAGLRAAGNRCCVMVLGMVLDLQFECWAANRRSMHQKAGCQKSMNPHNGFALAKCNSLGPVAACCGFVIENIRLN
jgi:hypothetical protein